MGKNKGPKRRIKLGRWVVYERGEAEFIHLSKPFRTKEQAEKERLQLKARPEYRKSAIEVGFLRSAADLQGLFDCYNRLYWQGRLPQYEVVVSTKYCGGFCEKRSRKIFLNHWRLPEDHIVNTLLHEMAHAAARGNGHGPTWQAEMKRLAKLGAPIDLKDSAPETRQSTTEILGEFEHAGREALDCP